jgi:hypothetical protein
VVGYAAVSLRTEIATQCSSINSIAMRRTTSGVYASLEASGILEHGTPEGIQEARRQYWNAIKNANKKEKRKREHAFTISFTDAELGMVEQSARWHSMSRTRFIKQAALAYVQKKYLVPDSETLRQIQALLSQNYAALQTAYQEDALPYTIGIRLLHKMADLEQEILAQLTNPKTVCSDY